MEDCTKAERKVLFEEFTAIWCGFCPRGAVGIAKAKQVYGEKIVPIAVHYQDEMDCPNYFQLIKNTVEGLPGGYIDRKYMDVDPYFGNTGNVKFAVSKLIDNCLEDTPKAELTAYAVIDGDILTARAEYRFLYDGKADCAVAYVVTQDSIKNDEWWQGNNYSGTVGYEDEPLLEQWVNADSKSRNPTTGIENVKVGNIKEISRYTVDGRQVAAPEKGLNIVKCSYGSVRKIIAR